MHQTSCHNWRAAEPHFGLLCAGWFDHTQALISGVSASCGFSTGELPAHLVQRRDVLSTVASFSGADGHRINLSSSAFSFEMMLPVHVPF